jgi:hypothetical protein
MAMKRDFITDQSGPLQISHGSSLILVWNGMGRCNPQTAITMSRSYVVFSLQKDEIIGGQTPSGYPGKELSVGSGVVSG